MVQLLTEEFWSSFRHNFRKSKLWLLKLTGGGDAGPGLDHYKRHYANLQTPIESGVIQGQTLRLNPSRVAGRAWKFGEQVMPGKASAIMARARRRMDQIASVETTLSGVAGGILHALNHRQV